VYIFGDKWVDVGISNDEQKREKDTDTDKEEIGWKSVSELEAQSIFVPNIDFITMTHNP